MEKYGFQFFSFIYAWKLEKHGMDSYFSWYLLLAKQLVLSQTEKTGSVNRNFKVFLNTLKFI